MDESDRKLVSGCIAGMMGIFQFLMIGTVFIYAITHW